MVSHRRPSLSRHAIRPHPRFHPHSRTTRRHHHRTRIDLVRRKAHSQKSKNRNPSRNSKLISQTFPSVPFYRFRQRTSFCGRSSRVFERQRVCDRATKCSALAEIKRYRVPLDETHPCLSPLRGRYALKICSCIFFFGSVSFGQAKEINAQRQRLNISTHQLIFR